MVEKPFNILTTCYNCPGELDTGPGETITQEGVPPASGVRKALPDQEMSKPSPEDGVGVRICGRWGCWSVFQRK